MLAVGCVLQPVSQACAAHPRLRCLEGGGGSARAGGCRRGGEDARGHPAGTSRVTRSRSSLPAARLGSRCSTRQRTGTDGLTAAPLSTGTWTSVADAAPGPPRVGSRDTGQCWSAAPASAGTGSSGGVRLYGGITAPLPPEGRAYR